MLTNFVHAPHASRFLELDDDNIPTGKYTALEKTQLDFRKPCALESVISGGYDQYLVHEEETIGDADNASSSDLRKVFQISTPDDCPGGSVCMHVLTNMPGFQFYTPSGFAEGQPFRKFGSFAVEPSEFIDAPNNANFPPITLDPNKTRDQHIVYKFTV